MKWWRRKTFAEHVDEALGLEVAETFSPTLVSQHQVAAALAQVPMDSRKILVVHPKIDNLALIKCEAAKMGLTVVLATPR